MRRLGLMGRVGWSLGDQVLSSFTNVALTILVAREVAPASFGIFVTLMLAIQFVLVMSRAMCTDPLMTRLPNDKGTLAEDIRGAVSSATLVGLSAGLLFAAVAIAVPGQGYLILVFALTAPGLAVQDTVRFVGIAIGRPTISFSNDALWALLQLGGVVGLIALEGGATALQLAAIWGGSASLCACVGVLQLKVQPSIRSARQWVRRHLDVSRYYLAENAALNGTNLLNISLIGVVATLEATASLRGAVALYGPLAVVSLGARAALVPELTRLARRRPNDLFRITLAASVGFTMLGLVWGVGLLTIPDSLGRQILGDTWALTRDVLPYMAIDSTVTLFTVGTFIGIRASGRAKRGLLARLTMVIPRLCAGVGAAAYWGAMGAAIAFAVLTPFYIGVWLWHLRRSTTELIRDNTLQKGHTL